MADMITAEQQALIEQNSVWQSGICFSCNVTLASQAEVVRHANAGHAALDVYGKRAGLGNELEQERLAAGVSVAEVARQYHGGISRQRIHQLEHQSSVSKAARADYLSAVALARVAQETAKRCYADFREMELRKAARQKKDDAPSLEEHAAYLSTCSPDAQEAFALAKLAQAENLFRDAVDGLRQAVQFQSDAKVALLLAKSRKAPLPLPAPTKMLRGKKERKG